MAATALLIATRKGLWILRGNAARTDWRLEGPHFLGNVIHHARLDPRDGRTLLVAARTGHLGPTVFRSSDGGATWQEAVTPPAFPKAEGGRVVEHVFWLTPGHASEPGIWYAGTSPQGLFVSRDGGNNWASVQGFNEHPERRAWCGDDKDQTPDGGKLHSVLVDPRDPAHLFVSMSSGGTFESRAGGADWVPINQGVRAEFYPDPYPVFGQDPHCVRMHPARPSRLYQQNHCGLFRRDEADGCWVDIGANLPQDGVRRDIGFGIVIHAHQPDTIWTIPMDAGSVWPRVSPEGKPCVMRSRDGGDSWQMCRSGLPGEQAWFTVLRQALTVDGESDAGVYFGTTGGDVWASTDEGDSWRCIARHLPEIYALEAERLA